MSRNLISRIIRVEGMTGAEFERKAAERLKGLEGVQSAGASASRSEIYVTYDSNKTSLSSILKTLEEIGCTPNTGAAGEGAGNKANQTAEVVFEIEGMTCTGCESRIQNRLNETGGVLDARVSFKNSNARISYDPGVVTQKTLVQAVDDLGYSVKKPARENNDGQDGSKPMKINQLLGIGIIALAIYLVINNTVGFNFLPQIDRSMGYGVLFAVGLITSLHCVAMCGGINLSQCVSYRQPEAGGSGASKLKPSLMYNAGRVLSYTVIGGIVGGLGTAVSFSGAARGIVAVISGAFMVIMGLNMLNVFPWLRKINPRMPKIFGRLARRGNGKKGPFIVGLLNGLMPCGPLQAMQLYALGTGSILAGALSMFMFSLGTVPLMFGLGAASSFLTGKFTHKMMKASAVLVMVLGLIMVNRGLSLTGINVASALAKDAGNIAMIGGDVQNVTSTLRVNGYEPIMVQKGIPVRWNIRADEKNINGCNNSIIIPKYGISKDLVPGDNIIEFTPDEEGNITYTCWMGMIRSNIQVVSNLSNVSEDEKADLQKPGDPLNSLGGGCGTAPPGFAGGKIPTDDVQVPELIDGKQVVTIKVGAYGYSPAVAVVQKGAEVKVKFEADQLNGCNYIVVFPEYQGMLNLSQEDQRETPWLPASRDFTFECSMSMLHGYVKVVDDINNVDIDAIREELSNYTPPGGSGGCCG